MELKIKNPFKDFPKIEGREKPQEPLVWTVYTDGSYMRARFHSPAGFDCAVQMDGIINEPLNFCEAVDRFRSQNGRA